jgi:hypothetical protein
MKILFCNFYFSSLDTFMRKEGSAPNIEESFRSRDPDKIMR